MSAQEVAQAMASPAEVFEALREAHARADAEAAAALYAPDAVYYEPDNVPHRGRDEIPRDRDVVVYCHVGARSAQAAVWMKASGWPRVRSLAGGIDAWSEQVDAEVPRYR